MEDQNGDGKININVDIRERGCENGRWMETGSGLCPVVFFGISSVEPLGSSTSVRDHLLDLHLYGRIVLKWILGKLVVKIVNLQFITREFLDECNNYQSIITYQNLCKGTSNFMLVLLLLALVLRQLKNST
jgi:hypothetical protein